MPASRFHPHLVRLLVVACCSLAVPSAALAGWSHDATRPAQLAVSASASSQQADAVLPDGNGGAFVFFEDDRAGNLDVYALHLLASGDEDPAWPAGGLALCTAVGDQGAIRAVSDGAGGALVCWLDVRSGTPKNYITRVLPTGTIAAGFAADGNIVNNTDPNTEHAAELAADGAGGVLVVYEYEFSPSDHDIIGVRMGGTGLSAWRRALAGSSAMDMNPAVCLENSTTFDLVWSFGATTVQVQQRSLATGVLTSSGVSIGSADGNQAARIVPDGWGGAVVAYVATSGLNTGAEAARYFNGIVQPFSLALFGPIPRTVRALSIDDRRIAHMLWYDAGSGNLLHTALEPDLMSATTALASANFDPGAPVFTFPRGPAADLQVFGQIVLGHRWPVTVGTQGTGALAGAYGGTYVAMRNGTGMYLSAACTDGNAGAIVIAQDQPSAPRHMFAMRIDRWGAYDGAPRIVSVKDVANDQGGHVRLSWNASYLDEPLLYAALQPYRVWRQVPVAAAQQALASGRARAFGAASIAGTPGDPQPGDVRIDQSNDAVFAWEFVASQIAAGFPQYSMTVPTVSDSAAGGPANTVYMVEAVDAVAHNFASVPDSGHSVDNLPPATPSGLVAALLPLSGSTQLNWNANTDPDLAAYELYRGTSAGFVPGPLNRVATVTRTDHIDPSAGQYYKLAARDVHGNLSGFALITPSGTLDTPGEAVPRELALALESANPARGSAVLRYDVPARARVVLAIYDVNGRVVRELAAGEAGAGRYSLRWDGRAANGAAAASGVYFARLSGLGAERVVRLVLSH